jgi:hypothetical protein
MSTKVVEGQTLSIEPFISETYWSRFPKSESNVTIRMSEQVNLQTRKRFQADSRTTHASGHHPITTYRGQQTLVPQENPA